MKCPLCGNEIISLIGPYKIFQPRIHNNEHEEGEVNICGRCYLLTSILDTLKSILSELQYGKP